MKRVLLFVLGLAAIVALVWYAGAGAVVRTLMVLGPLGLFVIVALHVPNEALMGLAWWHVRGPAPRDARPEDHVLKFLMARLIRDAAGEFLPFSQLGGFAVGARALALTGVELFRAGLSMFADLVTEFAAKLPYTLIGVVLLFAVQPGSHLLTPLGAGIAVAAAGFAAVFAFREPLLAALERAALALARKWTHLTPPADVASAVSATFAARGVAACFALHLTAWLLSGFETWVAFRLLGVHASLARAVVVDSLANGIRTFAFFIPSAAGAQEGAYVFVCALFGIGPASAVALSLARRGRDLVLAIPGLAGWQFLEARNATRRGTDNRREGQVAGMTARPD